MRSSSYVDEQGRYHAVMLPDDVPDKDAAKGIPVGPPSLVPLGLPEDLEIRLHNELFARKIFSAIDVKKRRIDVFAALQATFKIDIEKIIQVYLEQEGRNGRQRRPGFKPIKQPEPKPYGLKRREPRPRR